MRPSSAGIIPLKELPSSAITFGLSLLDPMFSKDGGIAPEKLLFDR